MLLTLKELKNIEDYLEQQVKDEKIYKYRIYINLDSSLSIDIVADNLEERIINELTQSFNINISIDEIINIRQYNDDEYYQNLFKKKIDKEHRRRLVNLIDINNHSKIKSKVPILSFYSYKGGVGRTTSLITFANYYAYHHAKKVMIMDFDFEAPGLTNYFDFSLEDIDYKNGVLEYLLDKQASVNKLDILKDYIIEVSNEYSGNGSIYVMPAGSLYGKNNLESYIEALSRVDFNSTDTIITQILELIQDINESIKPDIILIDSRTGFNDVFGFLINRISNIVVGLFEDNIQTEPGLKLFLNEIYKNNNISSIIVNSLVHKDTNYSRRLKEFSRKINDYLIELTDENFAPNIYELRKSNILGNLGTIEDDKDDYFDFIKQNTPNDYLNLFNKLIEIIDRETNSIKDSNVILPNDNLKNEVEINEVEINEVNSEYLNTESDFEFLDDIPFELLDDVSFELLDDIPFELLDDIPDFDLYNYQSDYEVAINTRRIILKKIYENYPKSYAENINFDDDFLQKEFYFRKCMEDIFNFDKFLLIGGKGTGKTAFYSALNSNTFLKNLKQKANKTQLKFIVIDIISLRDKVEKDKYFEINNFDQNKIKDKEFFYKRFWIIYILNSILIDKAKIKFYEISSEVSKILPFEFNNSTENKVKIENLIYDDDKIILIENELKKIDLALKKDDMNLIITFDQLDFIVKPILWANIISPLIDYCRSINYLKIQPKLFLRRDLYSKLTNLTNKKSLDTKIINLEWSKDEIFAFFFKVVFANSKDDFFKFMELYSDNPGFITKEKINIISKKIAQKNSYNQVDVDNYFLEPLVEIFFGKYPNPNKTKDVKYSRTYDWFYQSLANSDDTISIRPFLDLIKFAISMYLKKDTNYKFPILHPHFYNHKQTRKDCVHQYFEDLSNEEGNEDFKKIMEYIRDSSKFPPEFKFRRLKVTTYSKFLEHLIENLDLNLTSKEDIEEILILNGAIKIHYEAMNKKVCSFAYLYKYYLNLRG